MFDLLCAHAAAAPQRPFVMTGSEVTTYAEMAASAGRVAARLAEAGVTRGSRVGLICNNRIAWLEIFLRRCCAWCDGGAVQHLVDGQRA